MTGEFSVCQFFPDGSYEYTRRGLEPEAAVNEAKRLTETIGGRLGTTVRIIITDRDDHAVFEWRYGEGVTWPTPQQRAAHAAGEIAR